MAGCYSPSASGQGEVDNLVVCEPCYEDLMLTTPFADWFSHRGAV